MYRSKLDREKLDRMLEYYALNDSYIKILKIIVIV